MKNDSFIRNEITQFLYHQPLEEGESLQDQELIELIAYGLNVGPDMGPPVLILKAKHMDLTVPIPINPLEAGITLAQSNKSIAPVSPHKATAALLKELGMSIDKCIFVEIKNAHQYVKLFITGHPTVRTLKLKAEEVLSLCLYLEVPLFTTREFISRSRVMVAEIDQVRRELINNPSLASKNQDYMN